MTEREKKMFTLLHEVGYILVLQAEGKIQQKQFETWREGWMNEFGRLMLEMLAEQEKRVVESGEA